MGMLKKQAIFGGTVAFFVLVIVVGIWHLYLRPSPTVEVTSGLNYQNASGGVKV